MGDSAYDCNYCHGNNHLAKEYILRRISEKKHEEDDEAYYLRKIEELRKKKSVDSAKSAFIMRRMIMKFRSPHMVDILW